MRFVDSVILCLPAVDCADSTNLMVVLIGLTAPRKFMRPMAKEAHIKTDKNPLSAGVLGSYV